MSKELLEACEKNDIDQVKKSLKNPFDIEYQDEGGITCLHWTCINNNIELAKLLLDSGAKDTINVLNSINVSCLFSSCFHNNIELVKLLLDNGAKDSVNVIDYFRQTCLYWACSHNNINLVKLLLENGAIMDGETMDNHLNFLLKARL